MGYLLVAPALCALAAVALYPLVVNLVLSTRHDVLSAPRANRGVGLANYAALLHDPRFRGDVVQTVGFVVASVAIEFALGLSLALVVHRTFRLRGLVRTAILIPWAVPTVVSALLWKTFFDPRRGFIDYFLGIHTVWFNSPHLAWLPVVAADVWKNTPFVALLLLAGLQAIPDHLYESARIDGATALQSFRRITLPLLRPAILVALIFRTLSSWLVFDVVYVMTGGGPGTSTEVVSYYDWHAFMVSLDFGYGAAIAVAITAAALLLAWGYVRALAARGELL